jgi:hypothetical protein
MVNLVSWLVCTVLMFLEFGVLACSAVGSQRRSRFYIRLGCANVAMLALALGLAFAIKYDTLPQRAVGAAWMGLLLAALAVAPVLCYHSFTGFRGSSDGDGDGGGGLGSGRPPSPPDPPRGGAPLPDADQARARRRDHNRPRLREIGRRRPAVEPARTREPVGPRRR